MFNTKIFSIFNFEKYIFLLLISNFFSIILLNDTTSFNLGLISIQSLVYCLNTYLFIFFIILETVSSYLDFYGLTFNFLQLIFTNPKSLNLDFNIYVFFINLKYFLFLFLSIFFLFFADHILKIFNLFLKKKFFLIILSVILIILIFIFKKNNSSSYETLKNRISNKINFIIKGNFLRNDNWYIVFQNTSN